MQKDPYIQYTVYSYILKILWLTAENLLGTIFSLPTCISICLTLIYTNLVIKCKNKIKWLCKRLTSLEK